MLEGHSIVNVNIKAEPAGSFHGNHTMMDDVNPQIRNLRKKSSLIFWLGKFLESKRIKKN